MEASMAHPMISVIAVAALIVAGNRHVAVAISFD
jgi:hypothetical protein